MIIQDLLKINKINILDLTTHSIGKSKLKTLRTLKMLKIIYNYKKKNKN